MGKTTALMHLKNQHEYVYFNFDRKELTFKDTFMKKISINDPVEVESYIDLVENTPEVKGAVIDTITFMMDMYEQKHVLTSRDTRTAWGGYSQFYKKVMDKIKSGTKDYIILAHVDTSLNESTMSMEDRVPMKGAIGRTGIESDFSYILTTKIMDVTKLADRPNELLNITEDDEEDGVKRVFMTRAFKGDGSLCRSPMMFWDRKHLYIDNDLNAVMDRIKEYGV